MCPAEASNANGFDIGSNNHSYRTSKITNQTILSNINQEETGNSKSAIPFINTNIINECIIEGKTSNLTKTRRNKYRAK
jgi:uncharacterized protein YtpQ (UPF0354 family)